MPTLAPSEAASDQLLKEQALNVLHTLPHRPIDGYSEVTAIDFVHLVKSGGMRRIAVSANRGTHGL